MEQYLGEYVTVIIDRPIGTHNFERDYVYPVNYGYIPEIKAKDGKPVEAYLLGEFEVITSCEAYVEGILETNEVQRLILCKEEGQYSEEQMESLVEFNERFYDSEIITEEEDDDDLFSDYAVLGLVMWGLIDADKIRIIFGLLLIKYFGMKYIESEKCKTFINTCMKLTVVFLISGTVLSYIGRFLTKLY